MIEDKVWDWVASVTAVAAVAASKPVIERGWKLTFRSDPPGNPAAEDVTWRDAILWAVITGALVGLIRLLAQRLAAGAWQKATGEYPKELAATRP